MQFGINRKILKQKQQNNKNKKECNVTTLSKNIATEGIFFMI